jgi:hypothetical protein
MTVSDTAPAPEATPVADARVERTEPRDRAPRWFVIGMIAVCIGAALATALMAHYAFPKGSGITDESAYQAQANALAHGDLTLSRSLVDPSFRPFLSGVRGNEVVFKYQPVWPALIAASNGIFGSTVPLRVFLSVAGVLAIAWFAWELVNDRRVVLIAASLFALSPFMWVQSASVLGYQLSLAVSTATGAALLAATRRRSLTFAIVAGALFGVALFHRPFDALIAIGPVLVFALWRAARSRAIGQLLVGIALGGAPFAALFLAYNRAVMGNPLRMPFNVSGKLDTFGFGWRASFLLPGSGHGGQIHYTPGLAFSTLQHLFAILPRFIAFAPAVVAGVGVLIWNKRRDARMWLLVAMLLTIIIGYFFWWGSANEFHFKLENALGPFYAYPLLPPLLIAGAWGVVTLRSNTARLALVLLGVVFVGATSVIVPRDAAVAGKNRKSEVDLFAGSNRRVVLHLPAFANDPYTRWANDPDLRGRLVVGSDIPGQRFNVLQRFPDREVSRIHVYHPAHDPLGDFEVDRVTMKLVSGPAVAANLRANVPAGQVGSTYIRVGAQPLRVQKSGAGTLTDTFRIDPAALPADGSSVEVATGVTLARPGEPAPTQRTDQWTECRFDARRSGNRVEVVSPCDGFEGALFPDGRKAAGPSDISDTLQVALQSSGN